MGYEFWSALEKAGCDLSPPEPLAAKQEVRKPRPKKRRKPDALKQAAEEYMDAVRAWLKEQPEFHRDPDIPSQPDTIEDMLDVIAWYHTLITAKLHRALSGFSHLRRDCSPGAGRDCGIRPPGCEWVGEGCVDQHRAVLGLDAAADPVPPRRRHRPAIHRATRPTAAGRREASRTPACSSGRDLTISPSLRSTSCPDCVGDAILAIGFVSSAGCQMSSRSAVHRYRAWPALAVYLLAGIATPFCHNHPIGAPCSGPHCEAHHHDCDEHDHALAGDHEEHELDAAANDVADHCGHCVPASTLPSQYLSRWATPSSLLKNSAVFSHRRPSVCSSLEHSGHLRPGLRRMPSDSAPPGARMDAALTSYAGDVLAPADRAFPPPCEESLSCHSADADLRSLNSWW